MFDETWAAFCAISLALAYPTHTHPMSGADGEAAPSPHALAQVGDLVNLVLSLFLRKRGAMWIPLGRSVLEMFPRPAARTAGSEGRVVKAEGRVDSPEGTKHREPC